MRVVFVVAVMGSVTADQIDFMLQAIVVQELRQTFQSDDDAWWFDGVPKSVRTSVAARVEEDGNQQLWSFPLDRSDNGLPVFPQLLNVGYHCWLSDTLVAFFIVGDNGGGHTLQVAGTKAQKPRRIVPCLSRDPLWLLRQRYKLGPSRCFRPSTPI